MTDRPSPNHDARPEGVAVDVLVLHYTGMENAETALARLCDPAARVSAHYLVDEDGTIFRLVAESRRAWHAGVSFWRGCDDVNAVSIGVEIVNPGHEFGYRPYPEAQMAAVEALCRDIVARHPIPARNVVGHSDVAPGRRADPGELFDWPRLAAAGVGLWPEDNPVRGEMGLALARGDAGRAVADAQGALAEFGYAVPRHGAYDEATADAVAAFQRHFRPCRVDGVLDPETAQRLFAVLARA
ncbi:MAG: N-acetylmuramoyl-L-alanine amidase [Alphaproteobacteria bacterium]